MALRFAPQSEKKPQKSFQSIKTQNEYDHALDNVLLNQKIYTFIG
jgi:hypothetical protein